MDVFINTTVGSRYISRLISCKNDGPYILNSLWHAKRRHFEKGVLNIGITWLQSIIQLLSHFEYFTGPHTAIEQDKAHEPFRFIFIFIFHQKSSHFSPAEFFLNKYAFLVFTSSSCLYLVFENHFTTYKM